MQTTVAELSDIIHGITAPFACGGTLVPSAPVTIAFRDGPKIEFSRLPYREELGRLQPLIEALEPAPFGKGRRTIRDRTVRDALRAKAGDGRFTVVNFDPTTSGILEDVQRQLVARDPSPIRAELYDLNVYREDGHFVPHKDTPRGDRMLGTLVVCLPSSFSNGQLVVSNHGAHRVFDWSEDIRKQAEPTRIHWAAFFGDVDHSITKIWSGLRVTLTYLLHRGPDAAPEPVAAGSRTEQLRDKLAALVADRAFMPDGGVLGVPCVHMYSKEAAFQDGALAASSSSIGKLKGRDREVAAAALEAGLSVSLCPYLIENCADETWRLERFPTPKERSRLRARLDPWKLEKALPLSGSADEPEDDEVIWVDEPPKFNCSALSPQPMVETDDENPAPDEAAIQHFHACEYSGTGYFGNEGSDVDFYLYAALHIHVHPASERTAANFGPAVAARAVGDTLEPRAMHENAYCEALSIQVPDLLRVRDHPDANAYALLIVALLENGGPMTLSEVAQRFERVGIAPAREAMRSLQRCRPARPPVYRDGEKYALDPHDDDLDLWAFRLGLRPPKVPRLEVVRPAEPPPLGLDERLTIPELAEAWENERFATWSLRRLFVAVLDAHGRSMTSQELTSFLESNGARRLDERALDDLDRRGSPVRIGADGRWALVADRDTLAKVRGLVRERIGMLRRAAALADPAVLDAHRKAFERKRAEHAARLSEQRRVVVRLFPEQSPRAAVLIDVGGRSIDTYVDDQLEIARRRLLEFDVIAAVDVRAALRRLGVEHQGLHLADLGPPQKSKTLNRRGRSLKITTEMLIRGSCGISRPLGEAKALQQYLRDGDMTKLRRRLEADAKSLFALYQYGRLHGAVRLRWGFLDEMIAAPWLHRDEPHFYAMLKSAADRGDTIEVVAGTAPGWEDPWSRARRCIVEPNGYSHLIIDEDGHLIDQREVQLARHTSPVH